ncbi:MAG: LysR family transcriptional regulator [Nannocystaceae bacterium]|nr:LysR family transcriptional regulator [Nannocystaceae bacterium]
MRVEQINFHHLRYFWAVAKDGNLTRTAARLRVAQSALSSQIQQLEHELGTPLFHRQGRRLALTEAGGIALAYAEEIFAAGSQLLATFQRGRHREQRLRIGAVATLSRNFQESFVSPLLAHADLRLYLESGGFAELLRRLQDHGLDLVLSNRPPSRELAERLRCRRIARQPVSIVGSARRKGFRFPDSLADARMILPGRESDLRLEFDALCERLEVRVHAVAEVDDMAMMRLLARDTDAYALLPSVVVRDELAARTLREHCIVPGLFESFYAVTAKRKFQHPLLATVLARDEHDLLEGARPSPPASTGRAAQGRAG